MASRELFRILRIRRDAILERWLTHLSPLVDPEIEGGLVCVEDRAITGGIRDRADRRYAASAWVGAQLEPRPVTVEGGGGARVCVTVPRVPGASGSAPAYLVIDVVASTEGRETTGPLRIHAYDVGDAVRLVGLERPEGAGAPR